MPAFSRALSILLAYGLLGVASCYSQESSPLSDQQTRELLKTLVLREDAHPPSDPTNKFADNPEAAALGRKLFSDPRFSGALTDGDNDGTTHTVGRKGETQKVSCASCHMPASGFTDSRTLGGQISLAAGWGRRKTPSLLDVSQNRLLMWDGRKDSFQSQIFTVIESPVEMNSSRLFFAQQIARYYRAEYEKLFGPMPPVLDPRQFPILTDKATGCQPTSVDPAPLCVGTQHGLPGDNAEYDHLSEEQKDQVTQVVVQSGKAIGAYLRQLTCGSSRFDDWMRGDENALTASEQKGAELFVGKAHCIQCHSGAYFTDQKFHNLGIAPSAVAGGVIIDRDDHGAAEGIAQLQADPLNSMGKFSDGHDDRIPTVNAVGLLGAFRTPMLRCIRHRPSFFHTGQFDKLDNVLGFLNRGGNPGGYLGKNELTPLNLSDEEIMNLRDFLFSLEGKGPAENLKATLAK